MSTSTRANVRCSTDSPRSLSARRSHPGQNRQEVAKLRRARKAVTPRMKLLDCLAVNQGMLMEVAMTSQESDRWCSFQNRFMDLAREEQGRADVVTNGKVLRAMSVVRIDCSLRETAQSLGNGKTRTRVLLARN